MHEQLEADRPGHAQLRVGDRRLSAVDVRPGSGNNVTWINGWRPCPRILPYSEQGNLFNAANFNVWKEDPQNTTTISRPWAS